MEPDVVPVGPYMGNHAAKVGGASFIRAGCELAYYTPQENVNAMIRVARENRYPL
ncbi:hypothetical protein [Neomoorella mulderi]|nr:hypothetical protein [Moorella mulderi]